MDKGGEPEGDMEHIDGAPESSDYTTKFIAICRLLLDVGPKSMGAIPTILCARLAGPVPRFKIDSTFAPCRNRRPYWYMSSVGTELASGWIHVSWDGMGLAYTYWWIQMLGAYRRSA